VKKRIWSIPVIALLLIAVLGVGTVYAAGATKVFERDYAVQVEPIEVTELTGPIPIEIKPGRPIEIRYRIKNYDIHKDWNVVAEAIASPVGVGLESRWFIEEEGREYIPGTQLLIPGGYYRTLKVKFFPAEDMTISVRIYRTISEERKIFF
jgi:hypothetical protein